MRLLGNIKFRAGEQMTPWALLRPQLLPTPSIIKQSKTTEIRYKRNFSNIPPANAGGP